MSLTISLLAADGSTGSLTVADPTVNAGSQPNVAFTSMCLTAVVNGTTVAMDYSAAIAAGAPDPGTGIYYQGVQLKPFTAAAGQLWSFDVLTSSNALVADSLGWYGLDMQNLWLSQPWDNAGSTGDAQNETSGTSVQFTFGGLYLQPTTDDTAVQMAATPFTWTLTPVPTPPPPPPGQSYAPSNYVKVWEDTFTQANLDTTKWWTRYGTLATEQYIPSNNEQEIFEEGQDGEPNHVMTGSSVKLTAYGPRASDGRYPSGMLRCKETFNFGSLTTAFYIEVVAKIPNAQGAWPALWMGPEPKSASVPPPWPPEMDFAEFMINSANGDTSGMVGVNVQLNGANPPNVWNSDNWSYGSNVPAGWTWNSVGRTKWETNEDFSQAFHTFAIQCVPGVAGQQTVNPITGQPTHMFYYYCDGYNTFNSQYDSNIGADGSTGWNSCLLIDLAVGGIGGGTPNNAEFPCAFEIQRVSVFLSQEDSTALVPSVVGTDYMPPTGG